METGLVKGIHVGLISGKISQQKQTLNWLQSHLHNLFVTKHVLCCFLNQLGLIFHLQQNFSRQSKLSVPASNNHSGSTCT